MGNQNRTQRLKRHNQRSFDEEQSLIIDLDALIRRSILSHWSRTCKKKASRFKQEDLIVTIDWKEVLFKQDPIRLLNPSTIHHPRSQILYRTNFENQTANEHFYNVRAERTTCSSFRYLLTQTLLKSNESLLTFRLPDSISGTGIGISREHPLIFGRDVINTKDYPLNWPVDTQIRVASRTRASVELIIDEDEFHSDFLIPIRFSGRLTTTITTRQWPQHCLKIFENDVVSVVRDILKTTDHCGDLEVRNERSPYVFFTVRGTCSFRYGIKQSIIVRQESFDNSSMYFSDRHFLPATSSDYNCFTSTSLGTTEHTQIHSKHLAQL